MSTTRTVRGRRLARRQWLGAALGTGGSLLALHVLAACGPADEVSGSANSAEETSGLLSAPGAATHTAVATPAPPAPTPTATASPAAVPAAATATPRPSPNAPPLDVTARASATTAGCALPPLPGAFLGIDDRAWYGPRGAADQAQIIRFRPGEPASVLLKGLPAFSEGGVAASPDGTRIAYGRDKDRSPGNQVRPDEQGLWVMGVDGTNQRRLLHPPASPVGNVLAIGAIAWSPDGKTLAYTVQPLGSGTVCGDPLAGGVWLTGADHPQPRLLATAARLGTLQPPPPAGAGCSLLIGRLSWSPDGKTIAVSSARPKSGASHPGDVDPVVLAVDVASGAARTLVEGGSDGTFAPKAPAGPGHLAYVTAVPLTANTPAQTTLWLADAQGKQASKLVTQEAPIHNVVWSPDGRFLAFLGNAEGPRHGWTLQVVDEEIRTLCIVMTTAQLQQPPFLAGGSLDSLAWVPDSA